MVVAQISNFFFFGQLQFLFFFWSYLQFLCIAISIDVTNLLDPTSVSKLSQQKKKKQSGSKLDPNFWVNELKTC